MDEQALTKEAEVKNNKEGKADKPAKKTPPTPEPKKGKPKAGVNEWGHKIGSQSAQIDVIVKKLIAKKKALVVGEIAKETKLSNGRVSLHLSHLREDHKVIK